ncbi:hypothetical protein CC1G_14050 [Coprinopsis cinerea okayama7|uniref:SKP1 component POZ domain-containing protein n=1 Tax=Coprinopsis cinerea (strain Okayama-7 / 130 / ATCC MYA-4618 / FGSC 9003) TaxID=240176 RepID=D6RL26_COPC7|nr:hypothetical protein CC1G_14050 [Coprinopsis cinerea okayama7\|eukprot:XP_002912012.1 hypothetical protein CC1G_14050 [Coprinopsis cinerea okayama7\
MSTDRIELESREGTTVTISRDAARKIQVLCDVLDLCTIQEGPIPLDIPGEALKKIVLWCEHEGTDPKPHTVQDPFTAWRFTDRWEQDFAMSMNWDLAMEVYHASHYLCLDGLIDLMAYTMASHLEDLSPKDILARFGVSSDYSSKESEAFNNAVLPFLSRWREKKREPDDPS